MSLEELSPHHEIFIKAYRHNWDGGTAALKRMLKDDHCDRATAQMIYWLGHPEFYNQYLIDEIPGHASEVYKLIQFIEERFDTYPHEIAFDPKELSAITIPDDLGRIPAKFVEPTSGDVLATDLIEGRYGKMLLVHAAREGDFEVLKKAIDDGLDADAKIGRERLLDWACIAGHVDIVELLAEHGANLKRKTGGSGFTPLHWASQSKRENVIESLVGRGVSIDIKAKWGRTALHNAVYWKQEDWVEAGGEKHVAFLVSNGANPLAKDSNKKTPVDRAETVGNKVAVSQLKKFIADS